MIFYGLWDTADMDFAIILRVKFILQEGGVEIKPPKDKGGKYAGLKEYVFPHNRLVKLIIYHIYFKMFYWQLQLNSQAKLLG
jgi:hypothetical protein